MSIVVLFILKIQFYKFNSFPIDADQTRQILIKFFVFKYWITLHSTNGEKNKEKDKWNFR